jgi:exodeoxyribonuclease-3
MESRSASMRMTCWNCCEGFATKYPHLRALGFDVAVVAECRPFETPLDQDRDLTQVMKRPVEGPGSTKHLAVLAQTPWRVERIDVGASMPWLLPVRISGPVDFTVLAVWTVAMSGDKGRHPSYEEQTARVATEVVPMLEGPVLMAGDLNAPLTSRPQRHAATVEELRKLGLVDVYAATRGLDWADPRTTAEKSLAEPTYFHRRKRDEPFHIDHVFLPEQWVAGAQVEIGTYDDWVATRLSDHLPVIVDVEIPNVVRDRQ